MKLTVFNGSPKPGVDNTGVLAARFAEGFIRTADNSCMTYKLNRFSDPDAAVKVFRDAECVIIAFPLYNYSMPAIVMEFIERVGRTDSAVSGGRIGYIVQSGFPEAIHARALERYLEKLSGLLGREYLGTILKGGCSRLAASPAKFDKVLSGIGIIGARFGETGRLDGKLLAHFAGHDRLTFAPKFIMKGIALLMNTYWNPLLRKNGAYHARDDRPYQ